MESKTLEQFKKLFIEIKRNNALENLGRETDQALETTSGDQVDQTLRERDNQLLMKLQGRQRFFLKKIDAALERIDNGTFGECLDCGADISTDRLLARPTATMCICCKEDQERGEGHVLYEKKSHTHGKEILNANAKSSFLEGNQADDNIVKFNAISKANSSVIEQTI
jgi:DnaK suppressor protein